MASLLIPAGLLLLAVAVLQLRAVRFVTYPPALYCLVWSAALLWLAAAGDRYKPISDGAVLIFVGGAAAFSLGGALGWILGDTRQPDAFRRLSAPSWLVPALAVLVILLTPVYLLKVIAVVGTVSPVEFLYALRVRTLEATVEDGIGVVGNVVMLSMMCAMTATAAAMPTLRSRLSWVVLIVLSLFLSILTGGRGAPLSLIFVIAIIATSRARRVPVRHVLAGITTGLIVFGTMGVLIRKGFARPEATVAENIVATVDGVQDYILGGLIAFDRVVDDPLSVPDNGTWLRAARIVANRFGARHEIPSQHLPFTNIGDGNDTNVYTIYFAYLPVAGLAGTLVLTLLFGLTAAFVHRRAVLTGAFWATLFHGVLAGSVLQTVFNEPFYTNLNFLAKVALFSLVMTPLMRQHERRPVVSISGEGAIA
jgi:oligosaccharide repeat unit polymerase